MKAMELRELAQEALTQAQLAYNPEIRLRWVKLAERLAALAREQTE